MQQNYKNDLLREMLKQAMSDELADSGYYASLAEMANPTDSEILASIMKDEQRHLLMFAEIYEKLFGEKPTVGADEKRVTKNALKEYSKSIFDELESVEFYRKIYSALDDAKLKEILFEIITDEQAHAIKLNYLYASRLWG